MTLLIAGFGDLGHSLARACRESMRWRDIPVLAIRRNPGIDKTDCNVASIQADLTDQDALVAVLAKHPEISHIAYCAAPSERDEGAYRATYLTGLQNIVLSLKLLHAERAAKTVNPPKMLFVSSTAVYDNEAQGIFDESSPTKPRGFNGQVLLEAENWLMGNWPAALILRLSGIYGPAKQSLLHALMRGSTTVPDSDDYIANRIHIDDAAGAILHLLSGDHQGVYIGTDSHPIPVRRLYTALAKMLGVDPPKSGTPSFMMGKKQLSNQKLLSSGFELQWPDCLEGYKAIISKRHT